MKKYFFLNILVLLLLNSSCKNIESKQATFHNHFGSNKNIPIFLEAITIKNNQNIKKYKQIVNRLNSSTKEKNFLPIIEELERENNQLKAAAKKLENHLDSNTNRSSDVNEECYQDLERALPHQDKLTIIEPLNLFHQQNRLPHTSMASHIHMIDCIMGEEARFKEIISQLKKAIQILEEELQELEDELRGIPTKKQLAKVAEELRIEEEKKQLAREIEETRAKRRELENLLEIEKRRRHGDFLYYYREKISLAKYLKRILDKNFELYTSDEFINNQDKQNQKERLKELISKNESLRKRINIIIDFLNDSSISIEDKQALLEKLDIPILESEIPLTRKSLIHKDKKIKYISQLGIEFKNAFWSLSTNDQISVLGFMEKSFEEFCRNIYNPFDPKCFDNSSFEEFKTKYDLDSN